MGKAEVQVLDCKNVIVLKKPIQFGSETIEKLELRDPTAGDMRPFTSEIKTGDLLDLLGKLSLQPKAVIDKLSIADMNLAIEKVGELLGDGR